MITDSPAAILHRLEEIEQAMAMLQPTLAHSAHQRVIYNDYVKRAKAALLPKVEGKNAAEKEAKVLTMLEAHGPREEGKEPLLDASALADAHYAGAKQEFEVLDARRSILQSALKVHLREQEEQASYHGR